MPLYGPEPPEHIRRIFDLGALHARVDFHLDFDLEPKELTCPP